MHANDWNREDHTTVAQIDYISATFFDLNGREAEGAASHREDDTTTREHRQRIDEYLIGNRRTETNTGGR